MKNSRIITKDENITTVDFEGLQQPRSESLRKKLGTYAAAGAVIVGATAAFHYGIKTPDGPPVNNDPSRQTNLEHSRQIMITQERGSEQHIPVTTHPADVPETIMLNPDGK